jgi:hypothetical protein
MAGLARTASRMVATSGSARVASRVNAAAIAPSLIRSPKTLSQTATSRSCERWWPWCRYPSSASTRGPNVRAGSSPAGASPTVRSPQAAHRAAYTHASITTGRSAGNSTTWLRRTRRWPLSARAAPHPRHAVGRQRTTTSGLARRRLCPWCPCFGPRFFFRRSARFGLDPADGGIDEVPGPFGGRPSTLASNSVTRSYSRTISSTRASLSSASSSSRSIRPANVP